jgi:hypothetical protein
MTTDQQRAETALRIVSAHLADLLDPPVELNDRVDQLLCTVTGCLGASCTRTEEDWPAELADVKKAIEVAVTVLQSQLARHGGAEYGIDLPAGDR